MICFGFWISVVKHQCYVFLCPLVCSLLAIRSPVQLPTLLSGLFCNLKYKIGKTEVSVVFIWGRWMTTCLGKSSLFGLPCVSFMNYCQCILILLPSWFWEQDVESDCISSWSLSVVLTKICLIYRIMIDYCDVEWTILSRQWSRDEEYQYLQPQ